jgi:hypothetical protein
MPWFLGSRWAKFLINCVTEQVALRERGCDCVVWASDGRQLVVDDARRAAVGVSAVELATSPFARRMKWVADTVVLSLTGGDYSFHIGVPHVSM